MAWRPTSIYLLVISVIVPLSAVLKSSFKTKQLFVTANLLFFAASCWTP
ncbi:transporter [Lactobacillus delbrueckii subsp. bulgaricus]|nr:transporter [Lactobacillus delbrueckii subsp. bulgaricus]